MSKGDLEVRQKGSHPTPLLSLPSLYSRGKQNALQRSSPTTSPVEIRVVRKYRNMCCKKAWKLMITMYFLKTDDGTLIVSTQSDGMYFLFKGKSLQLWCVCVVNCKVRPLDSFY